MKKKYHKISNLDILCFFFCLFRLIMYVCVVYVQSRVVFVCNYRCASPPIFENKNRHFAYNSNYQTRISCVTFVISKTS